MVLADKEKYMRRALQLAGNGLGYASPNPMVGAVIVAPGGRIIGEGWHRLCGSGHAEVNAVASVKEADRRWLCDSTMFVTLEPCAHYGKTPPCAELILREGIRHVVIAMVDPFEKVSGKGIEMLRDGGVAVEVGVLEKECRRLNRRFLTAHASKRPFITLKWARSADGFMDWIRNDAHPKACRFSNALTELSTMRLRSLHDAVITTARTVRADDCMLNVRCWNGRQPRVFVVDRHGSIDPEAAILKVPGRVVVVLGDRDAADGVGALMAALYASYGVSSVLVEAGPTFLNACIGAELWDVAREEVAPFVLGEEGRVHAPELPCGLMAMEECVNGNIVRQFESRQIESV